MLDNKTMYRIAAYKEISAQISELEKQKKRLSKEIITAFDLENVTEYDGLKIIERTTETIKKENIPIKLWNHYKTTNTSRFIRACRA